MGSYKVGSYELPLPPPACFFAHRFYAENLETVLLYQTIPVLPDGLSRLPGCKKGGVQRLYYVKVRADLESGAWRGQIKGGRLRFPTACRTIRPSLMQADGNG